MEGIAYILCMSTALACAALLLARFRRTGTRLLLWCGLFFLALAGENAMLFVDLVLVPDTDLSMIRRLIPLCGVVVLLFGLIWDAE